MLFWIGIGAAYLVSALIAEYLSARFYTPVSGLGIAWPLLTPLVLLVIAFSAASDAGNSARARARRGDPLP